MNFKKNCFYKLTDSDGKKWLIQCTDVSFGSPGKVLEFTLTNPAEVVKVTNQEIKNMIKRGSIRFERLDDKLDIAKALLNGF